MKSDVGRHDRGYEVIRHVDPSRVGGIARDGAKWSALQIAGRQCILLISTATLARLLSPDDYGLMGMVATLTGLLLMFSDMGLSWSTLQRKHLTRFQLSNLFWVNAGVGLALWLVCIAVAPLIARFYNEPALESVVAVMGAGFAISGLSVQPFALMQRSMRFKAIASIEIAALGLGTSLGVTCALLDCAHWSLVAMHLSTQIFRMLAALGVSQIEIFRPRRGVGTRELVSLGGLLVINGVLIYLSRHTDSIFVGRYWGTSELGVYDRAYFLMLLPSMLATGAISSLMIPSLASLQEDRDRLGRAYRKAISLVTLVASPIAVGLALTADEAVLLVYGTKWDRVAELLQWLAFAGLTQPIFNTIGWLFTSVGAARGYLAVTSCNAAVLTAGFWISAQHSVEAVAAFYGLVMGLLLLLPSLLGAHRAASIPLRPTLFALIPICAALLILVVGVTCASLVADLIGLNPIPRFAIKVLAGIISYSYGVLRFVPRDSWGELLERLRWRHR